MSLISSQGIYPSTSLHTPGTDYTWKVRKDVDMDVDDCVKQKNKVGFVHPTALMINQPQIDIHLGLKWWMFMPGCKRRPQYHERHHESEAMDAHSQWRKSSLNASHKGDGHKKLQCKVISFVKECMQIVAIELLTLQGVAINGKGYRLSRIRNKEKATTDERLKGSNNELGRRWSSAVARIGKT